ncbi:ROK family protein (putative glucokinase) [Thermoflavimicrobium dichotomicum]|uniref:ROK family protein (Putative glucokinase) n=1 Tax=Thermoflavimicrobium dichotomicum TaxID=46223 RepID=A0A1I3V838_9BACL|nr:ROK family protein (putative glucokinase) [Thermoflavimicrobium dichotomicum]
MVKKINKSIVLETIKQKHPISRAQISELTGLNKGTVSSIVQELIEEEFVSEIGPGRSSGGRRPVMLLYNQKAGFAIGIDLNVNYLLTVLTDLQGNIVLEQKTYLNDRSLSSVAKQIIQSIRLIMDQVPKSRHGIVGVGIGIPGLCSEDGTILFAPNLGWREVDLKQALSSECSLPIFVLNEAHAGAIGEHLLGAGKGVSDLIYLSVGIGIGSGIIFNNTLYKGNSGLAGEIGHCIIVPNGKLCRCGNRGCWEVYASEIALLEYAKAHSLLLSLPEEKWNIETLIDLASQGHQEAIELFHEIGQYLGIGLCNIMHVFNPELIIIGNRFAQAEKWITSPIHQAIENNSLAFHRKKVRIRFANLGIHSSAIGAASLAITHFFSDLNVSIK